jgi:hypothetical protein
MLNRAPDGQEKNNGVSSPSAGSGGSTLPAQKTEETSGHMAASPTPDASSNERKLFKVEIGKQMASMDQKDRPGS